jgi:SSS family solute:Na+ symporter
MIGGMWAVALTDFVQVVVLTIGLVVLLVLVLDDVGGWSTVAEQLPKDTVRFFPVEHSYENWIEYIHVWMTLGIAAIASNSVIQRALSAKNESVAQTSYLVAAIAYVVIGVIPIFLGLVASITMPVVDNPNAVLMNIAEVHLQPILVVLFVGAILSSIMSTSDSILLSSAAIISTNLLPLVKRMPTTKPGWR